MKSISSPSNHDDADRRTPLEVFEHMYRRDHDPWRNASDRRERAKFDRTLAALGRPRYAWALELGSGTGVFTLELARRCDRVTAVEASATAVSRAKQLLRSEPHVEVVHGAIPEDLPQGPFDLVVCSEVLYYLSEPLLSETIPQIEQRLTRGGSLIAVHYTPSTCWRVVRRLSRKPGRPRPPAPLSGERVHELLRNHTRLKLSHAERSRTYRLERFDDPS